MTAPLFLVLSAPSGGGKTTLCQQMLAARPGLARAVTCTTRLPRPGERDGVDYHFLDAETFDRRVAAGEFLEHATVYGHQYGVWKAEVLQRLRAGADVILSVDVQGAASIRAQARQDPELRRALVSVFLTPPSLAVLEQRLRGRNSDAPEVIQRRLEVARREIEEGRHFDYLILSGSKEEDLRRLQAIFEAEKLRPARQPLPAVS